MATLSKIIFDKSTGKMYVLSIVLALNTEYHELIISRHISGFGLAGRVDPNQKWSDTKYVQFRLAKRPACDSDITEWTW